MNIMKKHLFILACLVIAASSAFAQSVTPDMARNEISAGKASTIRITCQGYNDTSWVIFNQRGVEKNLHRRNSKRDKLGRLTHFHFQEHKNWADGKTWARQDEQFIYSGNEFRPKAWHVKAASGTENTSSGLEDMYRYVYSGTSNAPEECILVELLGGGSIADIMYIKYDYYSFDDYDNWMEREETIYEQSIDNVDEALEKQLKIFCDPNASDEEVQQIQLQLKEQLLKQTPTVMLYYRYTEYDK